MSEICGRVFMLSLLPFEACEFPIARHTHQCIAIQWNLVGKVRGQGLAHDHGLVRDHGLVLEISGYLFKSVIFSQKQLRQRVRVDYRSLKP